MMVSDKVESWINELEKSMSNDNGLLCFCIKINGQNEVVYLADCIDVYC